MNNREIKQKIQVAFSHVTPPDVLNSVLSDCQEQIVREEKGKVFIMSEKRTSSRLVKWTVGVAAALAIFAGGGLGLHSYQINHTVDSIVSLDVNPSIEIRINQKEEVLDVTAKNDDARVILGDMDFRGSSLDVAVNALIGSMLRNGYLTEIANSILVSVDNDDPAKSAELQQKLTDEINQLLLTNMFDGSVLSQTIDENAELQQLADAYGITLGKAQLIQEIVNQDPRYLFEDLAALSINDLNLLHRTGVSTETTTSDLIETVGDASDKAYIGEDKAKAAALAHAGLSEADVSWMKTEFDFEDGVMVYEIEFRVDSYEYSYDINATTGDIVSYEKDREGKAPSQNTANSGNTNSSTSYITEAEAKAAALAHAGLSESDVTFVFVELDYDYGRAEYEVEFWAGNTEYDYEIDATNGTILSYDHDAEYYAPSQNTADSGNTNSSTSYITEAEAKAAALAHAGLSESDVTFVFVELDYDDGRAEYEVEFWAGNTEYDYEIDATNGTILSYDHDAEYYAPSQNTANSGNTNSSTSYITEAEAKAAALAHAGLSEADVTFVFVELDYDDGRAEYEVEFWSGNTEYDYEIDATNGTILSYDHDAEYYAPSQNTANSGSLISSEEAKSIALAHAGVSAADIREFECELDKDDGYSLYEIEFKSGGYEYSYEIDATNGTIIKQEKDRDD